MSEPDPPARADLAALLEEPGAGIRWALDASDDLHANLVRLDADHRIDEHVNAEVDVLVVVVDGGGRATVEGRTVALRRDVVVLLPRGARRRIAAGPHGLAYLTVHRRRGPLTIGGGSP